MAVAAGGSSQVEASASARGCRPRPRWDRAPTEGDLALPADLPLCPREVVVDDDNRSLAEAAPERRLQRVYQGGPPFFDENNPPYVNLLIYDSYDPILCDMNYTTPTKTVIGEAGYPADGTAAFRKRDMSCGVTLARFVIFTTDNPDYTDQSFTAKMMIKIDCWVSTFLKSDTCENVVDATSDDEAGFPTLGGCRFMMNQARLILSTRLRPNTRYDVTIKMLNPSGRYTASENSFHLTTEYYQVKTIEGTMSPVDMTYVIPNTKDWSELSPKDYAFDWNRQRGYITSFTWKPLTGEWFPDAGYKQNKFNFAITTWGVMTGTGSSTGMYYRIAFVAYPTNIWKFCLNGVCREPKESCDWSPGPGLSGAECEYESFPGAKSYEANGFIVTIKGTPLINLQETFTIKSDNPTRGVNLYWSATSYRYRGGAVFEPYTVLLNSPVPVLGEASGRVVGWEIAATNAEQWVELGFKPGNTLLGAKDAIAGTFVVIPPDTFTIVASAQPEFPDPEFNSLPCALWPMADREDRFNPRWVCTLADQALFQDTFYRVKLKVVNPQYLGAARSWRIEIWAFFAAGGWVGGPQRGGKPISVTRSLLGMPISGTMKASIAPTNQLLGGLNLLRFEFQPEHDIGGQVNTRLKVVAPMGFLIVKRCLRFNYAPPLVLPDCECQGSDANTFDLVFTKGDAIKGGQRYIFELMLQNPSKNVDASENVWQFDTVRPDGVPRDTARYPGFYLFPTEMARFSVVPVTRQIGPNPVILRFTSTTRIPFDDFITIRAPLGVEWNEADLGFTSENVDTNATTIGTFNAVVDAALKHVLTVQLTTAAEANIEYGFRAKIIIPTVTPVPNRWWIEQKRQTGLLDPMWRYLASTGAEGFESLVLVNAVVEPWNVVEEAWENPTLITFEATQPVFPTQVLTAAGTMNVSAQVLIQAPPGFTWICPLSPTPYMPPFGVLVPSEVECEVDHNNKAKRNELSLWFPSGIQAHVRYTLTIDLVNGELDTFDLARNFYRIVTRLGSSDVEEVAVPGFLLARRMDNTRFWNLPAVQNFFPEFPLNTVTFYIGTISALTQDTILQVKAPRGFEFAPVCTNDVSYPGDFPPKGLGLVGIIKLPTIVLCQNLQYQDMDKSYMADISLTGPWLLGTTAISMKVKNPMRTPSVNFWGFTIMARDKTPLMSESRVYGFQIAVVLNPVVKGYNDGESGSKEAAINRIQVGFELTTDVPGGMNQYNEIVITAPQGFSFPKICMFYAPGTDTPGTTPLHPDTQCAGDGKRQIVLTLPMMRPLRSKTRYEVRFRGINPEDPFNNVDAPDKWWSITTRRTFTNGTATQNADQTRDIPSFPVYPRVSFIQADTLSQVGLNSTTNRFLIRTSAPLPPKQTITIYAPPGFKFWGMKDAACVNVDPMIIKRQFDEDAGMKALIAGVTRMPEWIPCTVDRLSNAVVLLNDEPLLGGRPLINGPVYELFVMNATNGEETPPDGLNLYKVNAKTMVPGGMEEFAGDGWIIYPQLLMTSVETSNPGLGLYTNFTFTIQTVSLVPPGGSIQVIGPEDYYFGPLIESEGNEWDPLISAPPRQMAENSDRPTGDVVCGVLRPTGWACPFDILSCKEQARLEELRSIGFKLSSAEAGNLATQTTRCAKETEECASKALSNLVSCTSLGNVMTVTLSLKVQLPKRRAFRFIVQGYNVRNSMAPRTYTTNGAQLCTDCPKNTWSMRTRDANTEQTVLDKKASIPGMALVGVVSVISIIPSDTKVDSIENTVTVTLMLDRPCEPRATLTIKHPIEYLKSANAAYLGAPVSTGSTFPRMKEIRQSMNVIEIIAMEETIPAGVELQISIIMSNPGISPSRQSNIWSFEASSMRTGSKVIQNVNYNVSGFKIFGEVSRGAIMGTVVSPSSDSIIGVWLNLKSPLPIVDPVAPTPNKPQGLPKAIRIWMPKGFQPIPPPLPPRYVAPLCSKAFSLTYNPNREGVVGFPASINYVSPPSDSSCRNHYDPNYDQYYAFIEIDPKSWLDSGIDYAFEFGATNPSLQTMPPPEENFWRIDTVMDSVILHLKTQIPGYELEQIKVVRLTYGDTTKRMTLQPLTFDIMADKFISGGSKIIITGPESFSVSCVFFRPLLGLSSTTTCLVKQPHVVEFTIDSQDPKEANTPMSIRVMWTNPEFTPQNNWWKVVINSPLGQAIDLRDFIPGFDITDRVDVYIKPTFAYLGEMNPLRVIFLAQTIMNQADDGNQLRLDAPAGYVFRKNCTGFNLRLTDNRQETSSTQVQSGYASGFVFPPAGTTCQGFDNQSVIIMLPSGAGLLKNNYTLEVDVENPGYRPNITGIWKFFTRVVNANGTKIVDANRTVAGFDLAELLPIRTDEGAAWRGGLWLPAALLALSLLPLWRRR